jgi:hypothetical protein
VGSRLCLGFACALALVAGVSTVSASAATTPCWQAAIADWSKDDSIDGHYSAACLRSAMQNAPTDLKIYSSVEDDLRAALRTRSVRRLAGVHRTAAASIATPSGSSPLSPLAVVLAGVGVMVAACTAGAIVRRRRTSR